MSVPLNAVRPNPSDSTFTVRTESVPAAPPVKRPSPKADESQGSVDLTGTDEKTAAVIMAIVSKESKIPLERLKFNSIKLIESEDDTK